MSKLMQAKLTLKGSEIDFAENALKKAIERCSACGLPDTARPYEGILEQIQTTRRYGDGTKASISLVGGSIDCMKFALRDADNQAEGTRLLKLLQKRVRGLNERYV